MAFPHTLFAAPVSDAPMQFESRGNGGNCNECAWISAEGVIEPETPQKFLDFIEKEKITYQANVFFNSLGGDVGASIKLGNIIREKSFNTKVASTFPYDEWTFSYEGGLCESACVYSFMGGVQRSIAGGSRIGVHQFKSYEGSAGDNVTQKTTAQLGLYMNEMGVSRDVIVPTGLTSPDNIYWLSQDQLEKWNVITSRSAPEKGRWQLTEYNNQVALTADQVQDDGKVVSYILLCGDGKNFYHMASIIRTDNLGYDDVSYIANSISGVEIDKESDFKSIYNSSVTVKAKKNDILIMSSINIADLILISASKEGFLYNLDMPMSTARSISSGIYSFTTNDLFRLLKILDKNCLVN